MEKSDELSSHAVRALQAHNSKKQAARAQVPKSEEDISSLNQLLQWATANSANSGGDVDGNDDSKPRQTHEAASTDEEQLRKDREWLDTAFPDMYAGVRELVAVLETPSSSTDDRVEALHGLQEFFLDLNYAINIDKVGALDPVLRCAEETGEGGEGEDDDVRAAAVWVLGTAMQHLSDVKKLLLTRDAHKTIAARLSDNAPAVRAKAVMAASALLRHADTDITRAFDAVGGTAALRARLADSHQPTRRRARFFLQHAPVTGNTAFVDALIADRNAVAAFSASLPDVDTDDYADVEAAVGALSVLVDSHLHGLLQVAPEVPGVLDDLASRCSDDELVDMIRNLANRMD